VSGPAAELDPRVGLCSACRFARPQRSAKGSVFWRCLRARSDPSYLPYPPLPVKACPGFERRPSGP
jgi:hypothetical protein